MLGAGIAGAGFLAGATFAPGEEAVGAAVGAIADGVFKAVVGAVVLATATGATGPGTACGSIDAALVGCSDVAVWMGAAGCKADVGWLCGATAAGWACELKT